MEKIVTVIIPSYNRAHLLEYTIPSYLQDGVKEIIFVDDCSTDNTELVVKRLQKKMPEIKYVKHPKNLKQPAAKNTGLKLVTTPWVYFGDDDSVLMAGSIERLLDTCVEYGSDACGACAYYMKNGDDINEIDRFIQSNIVYAERVEEIVDIKKFSSNFSLSFNHPVEVPFCHACMLIKSNIAQSVLFDINYKGNAYREETDFIINCSKIGAKIFYDSRAAQVNLPPMLATGGARGNSAIKYKFWMIRNNRYFLDKNYEFLREKYKLKVSKINLKWNFEIAFATRPLKRLMNNCTLTRTER